ncbi:MAG TPA: HAD-IIA family hydrolase [Candidatus Caldiarchaeum subterraneum]|uniref:HAD-IIA family hydrolase n=1 Tax=Caldiarchaeum subterraneum TaxID=311458 RepID=A0A832ZUU7_CALS0|nr:HAD-IIA family hydrolase [Candidatus Caldarchaeum subterraneum]
MSLDNVRGLVIDLDGCIYLGKKPIEGAAEAIGKIRRAGYSILFLTNNSTLTRGMYVRKLRGMGVEASEDEILTSGVIAARYIASQKPRAKVLPVAEAGFTEEARKLGIEILDESRYHEAEYVTVGLDRTLTYRKLAAAVKAINMGACFICTNLDHIYPGEEGFEPGAGAIAAAIEKASGVKPYSVGKPSEEANRQVFEALKLSGRQVAFVGDRIDTDIKSAKMAGAVGVMVMTGAASLFNIDEAECKPDYVIESIVKLPELLGVK